MAVEAENEAGKAYLANVSVTEARVYNPLFDDPAHPETWVTLSARDYQDDLHGKCEFYCPCCLDKGDKVRLKKPSGEYYQSILFDVIDPETGDVMIDEATQQPVTENRRYFIPPRYSLYPMQRHTCDLAARLSNISKVVKEQGGVVLNSTAGAYIVNLNIPAGQSKISNRPRIRLSEGDDFTAAVEGRTRRIHRSSGDPTGHHSRGITNVQALAQMLDDTEFNKGQRQHLLMRIGQQGMSLAEAYHGDPLAMYRSLYERERPQAQQASANHNHVAIFRFRPIGDHKFWKKQEDGSMTVQGQAEQVRDRDGKLFYVSARVNFQTEGAFQAFQQAYTKNRERSFLVYTENAKVDLADHAAKKQRLDLNLDQHATVFVDTVVYNPAQMMPWSPRSPQLTLFEDLDPGRKKGGDLADADASAPETYEM